MAAKANREFPSTVAAMEAAGMLKSGELHACLKEFDKPAGARCPHQRHHKGCAVYERRPFGCRTWNCRWLVDDETAAMSRPDRSHYVIDLVPDFVRGVGDNGAETIVQVVQIWLDPDYPDAHRDPQLRRYLEKQFRKGIAALVRIGRDRGIFIIGPPLVDAWREVETLQDEHEHTAEEKARLLGPMSVTIAP